MIQEFSFKWVKVMLPYKVAEGCLKGGGGRGGGIVMTHTAGSVTIQSIAFKYVIDSEPYRTIWYLRQAMAGLPYIKIYFFQNTYGIERKLICNLTWTVLDSEKNF